MIIVNIIIANNEHLRCSIADSQVTIKGASHLFETLNECKSTISLLSISCVNFNEEFMKPLGECIQCNQHLETLHLVDLTLTDKGIEILSEFLIGNTTLKELGAIGISGITNASVPHLLEIVKKSYITNVVMNTLSLAFDKQNDIREATKIPILKREIPIKSNTKSAAKTSY